MHTMRLAESARQVTVDEYLELEKSSSTRHEYAAGKLFAMAGGSEEHNRIVLNIASRLLAATRGGPCRVFASDMKLRVDDVFYYPDVFVCCDPTDADRFFKLRPTAVFEVLSDSTEAVDRGEKLYNYRRVPTLNTYTLVSQEGPRVEVYRRRLDGSGWTYDVAEGVDAKLSLEPPGLLLTLAEIYEGL